MSHDVKGKEMEYFTEEVAEKYKQYCKRIKSIWLDQRNAVSLTVYIETIPTMCTQFNSICQSAVTDMTEIVKMIAEYRAILCTYKRPLAGKSKEAEDSEEEEPEMKDALITSLN